MEDGLAKYFFFSRAFDEHLARLCELLYSLQRANLQINTRKCNFGTHQIKILGQIVRAEGVRLDGDKTRAVAEFTTPKIV